MRSHDQAFASEPNRKVITLLRDHLNQSHPLATKVADLVWELFNRYRLALEDPNRSYQILKAASSG